MIVPLEEEQRPPFDGVSVDVILRDGSTLRLRQPTRNDVDALVRFFADLSDQSLYRRFHGHPMVDARLVASDLDPDWVERGALIGAVATADGERVVTLAGYVRLRDPNGAEVAFAVADEYQHRGIGTRLLEQLAALAAAQGIERFLARCSRTTGRCSRVFEAAGFEVTRDAAGGEVEVTFPIAPTERLSRARRRARPRGGRRVAARLLRAAVVAVVGASPRRGSIGGGLFRNVLDADFTGAAYPVNRRRESVAGVRGYASIEEIPDAIDLAVICVPGEYVLAAAEAALRQGVRALCVISAGFAEIGAEGARTAGAAARARARARRPHDRARTASASRPPARA